MLIVNSSKAAARKWLLTTDQVNSTLRLVPAQCRPFAIVTCRLSGHNRWSKIKHDKGKNDAVKSRERTSLVIAIIKSCKEHGPDPILNTSLQLAINNAKKAQISKEAIEKAIAKGQGKSVSGMPLETVMIEAMLPHGVAAIAEGQADNKKRVLGDVKSLVQRAGGSLSPTLFAFEQKGKIWFKPHDTIGIDEAMDEAIEAGAEEINMQDGQLVVETTPALISSVAQHMSSALALQVDRSEIVFDPKPESVPELDQDQLKDVQDIVEQLEDLEDLQDVWVALR